MRADPRSLRYRALVVVVAVVVLPLLWVWVAGTLEARSVRLQREALHQATAQAVAALASGEALGPVARAGRVRLRLIGADGRVLEDHDHGERASMLGPMADPFYGPQGAPALGDFDRAMPAVADREEVIGATEQPTVRCEVAERGLLLVCSAAQRSADGRIVHLMRGSRRLVRSLYDDRFQLTALTLWVLVIGVSMALWIGWRMVGPIEQLRDQVVARTRGPVSTEPVRLQRSDELGELAEAFNELLRALEHRNRSNAAFVADLAHELKNPVAAVRMAADTMAADRPVDGVRRERLHRVLQDSAARMQVVVERFLELARAEAGLPDVQRERLDVTAMIRGLVTPLDSDPRYARVDFEVEGEPAVLWAVSERLETALRNLLANAAHFASPDGSVRVRVRMVLPEVAIQVQDTGPGVAEGDRIKIFERYFTTREGGTGLGLPLTKAIVEAHGGRIEVSSPQGTGACFCVWLPLER